MIDIILATHPNYMIINILYGYQISASQKYAVFQNYAHDQKFILLCGANL